MDVTLVPMLHTLVLHLPEDEAASGWDFQCLLRQMGWLRDQIQHLVFGVINHPDRAYSSLTSEDLEGLRSFPALRQLSVPTQERFGVLHGIIGDVEVHPHMEICTVHQRYIIYEGQYAPLTHTMFFDAESRDIILQAFQIRREGKALSSFWESNSSLKL